MGRDAAKSGDEEPKPIGIGDGLSMARDVAAVLGIYLLFTGFVYRFYFYDDLGIPMPDDIPTYALISDAWTVIEHDWFWLVLAIAGFASAFTVLQGLSEEKHAAGAALYRRLLVVTVLIAACAGFPGAFYASRATAFSEARTTLQGDTTRPSEFVFDAPTKKTYPSLEIMNEADGLRIVSATSDSLFILQIATAPNAQATIYAIKRSSILSYRTFTQ